MKIELSGTIESLRLSAYSGKLVATLASGHVLHLDSALRRDVAVGDHMLITAHVGPVVDEHAALSD